MPKDRYPYYRLTEWMNTPKFVDSWYNHMVSRDAICGVVKRGDFMSVWVVGPEGTMEDGKFSGNLEELPRGEDVYIVKSNNDFENIVLKQPPEEIVVKYKFCVWCGNCSAVLMHGMEVVYSPKEKIWKATCPSCNKRSMFTNHMTSEYGRER